MAHVRYAAQHPDPVEKEPVRNDAVQAISRSLWAEYETDPEIVTAVLPPPLASTGEPIVHVKVGRAELASGHAFGIGSVAVRAKHGENAGTYALTMPMSSEAAVIGGRETFGEPKKLADIVLERDGNDVRGTVTRHGITYLEIRGTVVEQLETPPPKHTLDFYFKFLISPDKKGFDDEPALVYCRRTLRIRKLERVEGEVILRESPVDPVIDLPVRRLISLTFAETQSEQKAEIVCRVPAESIAPFVHQRYDRFSWN